RLKIAAITVTTLKEALEQGEVVLVAIPAEHHDSLPRHLLAGKIVVDVSNRSPDSPRRPESVAERLQECLPESHVVKAFNTLSAFALQQGDVRGSKEVPICSNSSRGRERVSALVKVLGFTPIDRGVLENARDVENIPFRFFPERQICPNIQNEEPWDWNRFIKLPLNNGMLAFALSGTVLLLMCYVPGMIAAYIQLSRGTKYSTFPSWLDRWLKARKQMAPCIPHLLLFQAFMSIFTLMATGMKQPLQWTQNLYLALGAVLTAVLAILGVATIPSVAATLTWREFDFLQRYLGWLSVVLVTLHALFKGNVFLLKNRFVCYVIPHETHPIISNRRRLFMQFDSIPETPDPTSSPNLSNLALCRSLSLACLPPPSLPLTTPSPPPRFPHPTPPHTSHSSIPPHIPYFTPPPPLSYAHPPLLSPHPSPQSLPLLTPLIPTPPPPSLPPSPQYPLSTLPPSPFLAPSPHSSTPPSPLLSLSSLPPFPPRSPPPPPPPLSFPFLPLLPSSPLPPLPLPPPHPLPRYSLMQLADS
ncbi:putative metalloreductase STEAP3 isoform X6, partial [Penaeus vannamei]